MEKVDNFMKRLSVKLTEDSGDVDHYKSLGVLYTGYLEKKSNSYYKSGSKMRFVVLTREAFHWFQVISTIYMIF